MIKKRNLWKLLLVLGVVIGGVAMFTLNQQKTEGQQKRELETNIAKLLVNDYENVKEIEFQGWKHSLETRMWKTTVVINEDNRISFSFNDLSGLEEISSSSYHPHTFKLTEKARAKELEPVKDRIEEIESVSLANVEVVYSYKKRE